MKSPYRSGFRHPKHFKSDWDGGRPWNQIWHSYEIVIATFVFMGFSGVMVFVSTVYVSKFASVVSKLVVLDFINL